MAYRLLAWSAGTACRFGDAADAYAEAVEHARRAGDVRQERRAATAYAGAAARSGRRTSTRRSHAARRASRRPPATASRRATCSRCSAALYAMQGAFDHARELVARARALLEELGLDMDVARVGHRGVADRDLRRRPRGGASESSGGVRDARRARRAVPPLDRCRTASPRRSSSGTARSTRRRRWRTAAASSPPKVTSRRRRSGAASEGVFWPAEESSPRRRRRPRGAGRPRADRFDRAADRRPARPRRGARHGRPHDEARAAYETCPGARRRRRAVS